MYDVPTQTVKATINRTGRDETATLGRMTRCTDGRPKTLFGLCDPAGQYLNPVSYDMACHPAVRILESTGVTGGWFVLWSGPRAGQEIRIEAAELHRVLLELDLMAPETYNGVTVPEGLVSRWVEPEGYGWRAGVDAAVSLSNMAEKTLGQMVGSVRDALEVMRMEGAFHPDPLDMAVERLADIIRNAVQAVQSAGAHVDLMNECCSCSRMELYVQLGAEIAKVEI